MDNVLRELFKLHQQPPLIEIGYWRQSRDYLDKCASQVLEMLGCSKKDTNTLLLGGAAAVLGFVEESKLPWPGDMVDVTWDEQERNLVAYYLEHGFDKDYYFGYSTCRLCGKWNNGCRDMTDHVYVWPEGYAHYLREHSVKPPHEFIDHVTNTAKKV